MLIMLGFLIEKLIDNFKIFEKIISVFQKIKLDRVATYEFYGLGEDDYIETNNNVESYGIADMILYFKNNKISDSVLDVENWKLSIQNYKRIEFKKIILDVHFDYDKQLFRVYSVNNGNVDSREQKYQIIAHCDDEKILEENFIISPKVGEISLDYSLGCEERIVNRMVQRNLDYIYLEIIDNFGERIESYFFDRIDNKLSLRFNAVSPARPPRDYKYEFDFFVKNNENYTFNQKYKIPAKEEVGVKINIKPIESSEFDLIFYFKEIELYRRHFKVKVPVYFEKYEKTSILMCGRRSEFMVKNNYNKYNAFTKQTTEGSELKYNQNL